MLLVGLSVALGRISRRSSVIRRRSDGGSRRDVLIFNSAREKLFRDRSYEVVMARGDFERISESITEEEGSDLLLINWMHWGRDP